jgi:hypothetical protein
MLVRDCRSLFTAVAATAAGTVLRCCGCGWLRRQLPASVQANSSSSSSSSSFMTQLYTANQAGCPSSMGCRLHRNQLYILKRWCFKSSLHTQILQLIRLAERCRDAPTWWFAADCMQLQC